MAEQVIGVSAGDIAGEVSVGALSLPHQVLESALRQAIEVAQREDTPFGAALVDASRQQVTAVAANSVRTDGDPLAHAEMNVLRVLRPWETADGDGWNQILVSTAEPCPLCSSAAVLLGVGGIVFGTSMRTLCDLGWRQILVPAELLTARATWGRVPVVSGFLSALTDASFARRPPRLPVGGEEGTN